MIDVDRFPMTEPMRLLRADYVELHSMCCAAKDEHEVACKAEAQAEYDYALHWATVRQRLLGEGSGLQMANAMAKDGAVEIFKRIKFAKAAKDNAGKAMTLLGKQLEVLTAAFHAHNREVRTLDKTFVGDPT